VSRAAQGLAVALWAGLAGSALAIEWRSHTEDLILHSNETWPRELAAWAPAAEIDGVVREDFFLATRTARLGGRFEGDVWVWAAERIDWDGRSLDDVRLASPVVVVKGHVEGTLLLAAGTVKIGPEATLGRRTTIRAQDVIFQGRAAGPVLIRAARITLGGEIDGPVQLEAQDIVVQPGTRISGLLRYTAPTPLALGPEVRAEGGVLRHTPPKPRAARFQAFHLALALLVLPAFALLLAAPRLAAGAAEELRARPFRCLWTGAGWILLAPAVIGVLAASGIGLAVGLAIGGALVAALLPGATPPALALGRRMGFARGLKGRRALWNQATPGLMLLAVLILLPGLGPVMVAAVLALGGGALLRTMAGAGSAMDDTPDVAPADESA
jgi:cytoskeletal protein CcmA (bactofilin family)